MNRSKYKAFILRRSLDNAVIPVGQQGFVFDNSNKSGNDIPGKEECYHKNAKSAPSLDTFLPAESLENRIKEYGHQ